MSDKEIRKEIREAIARAWRYPENSGKEVEVELIDAIVSEISSAMAPEKRTSPDALILNDGSGIITPIGPEVSVMECIREMQKQNAEILKLLDKIMDMPNREMIVPSPDKPKR